MAIALTMSNFKANFSSLQKHITSNTNIKSYFGLLRSRLVNNILENFNKIFAEIKPPLFKHLVNLFFKPLQTNRFMAL